MRFALLCVTVAGCSHGDVPRPAGPEPTVEEIVSHLGQARDELRSFTGSAVMEYWLGNDRFKGDVLAMGETTSKHLSATLSNGPWIVGGELGQGDADGHAGNHLVAVTQHDRLLESGADPPGRGHRHVHPGHVLQQHHELVAAKAGQQVIAAYHAPHAGPDRDQELVAGDMAQAVVDALEAIDVDEDECVGRMVRGGPRERVIETIHQQPAVGQAREAVIKGAMVELVLEGLAFGDVAEGNHRA